MNGLRLLGGLLLGFALAGAGCSSDESDASDGGSGGGGSGGTSGASGSAGAGGASGSSGSGGSAGTSDAGACSAAAITFTPSWTPPQPIHQGVCSEAQIDEIVKACFEGGGQSACATARAAHPQCDACLISDETDNPQGAIIYYASRGYYDRNYHGCVAHAQGDLSASGCGATCKAAFWDCPAESCTSCFPASSQAAISAFNACADDAYEGTCKSYVDDFNACSKSFNFSHCIWVPAIESWATMARRYAALFCGSDADGGTDAGDAGGAGNLDAGDASD